MDDEKDEGDEEDDLDAELNSSFISACSQFKSPTKGKTIFVY